MLAFQVLGAFWYFFSTQRLTACWHISCENHIGCVRNSFNCDHNLENHSFLNDLCPITTANTTLFDFGIFLQALQSGVVESTDIPQKILYCFWWGMQNLRFAHKLDASCCFILNSLKLFLNLRFAHIVQFVKQQFHLFLFFVFYYCFVFNIQYQSSSYIC